MKQEMGKILFRMFSTSLFQTLAPRERAAVLDAVLVGVMRGGPIGDAERSETRRGILALPWAWDDSQPVNESLDRAAARMSHVEDPTVLGQLARAIATSLPRPEVRERVFRAMLALLFADGGSDRDVVLLEPVRTGFGIGVARGDEILEDLKDELVDLVV